MSFSMHKSIPFLLIVLILLSIILSSWHALQGTLNFHTDIARDFLLFEDIYYNKNITLIGPRSGGISGVFHGPLWLYLNIPAYVLGQGNPVAIGWFWVVLFLISIYGVYYVGKKMFSHEVGLMASVLYSSVTASSVHSLFNPFGAVILFPIFYYYFWLYLKEKKILHLIISILTIGFITQFQMAFGVPILVLIIPYICYVAQKRKDIRPVLTLVLLVIPLSSYILFDLRHDFLQTRSVLEYLAGKRELPDEFNIPFTIFLFKRMQTMIDGALGMVTYNKLLLTISLIGFMVFVWFKRANKEFKAHVLLFLYLFVGYFLLTLTFKGQMWGYYYWPFIGVIALLFSSVITRLKKKELYIFTVLISIIYLSNFIITWRMTAGGDFSKENGALWSFYKRAAETVYNDAPSEFGYYIYTNDQFGYSTRYAMNYLSRKYDDKKVFPFEKKKITYLMIDDLGDHKFTNHKDWRKYDVKLEKIPDWIKRFNRSYFIERYTLTPAEEQLPSNPNLIHTLIFR